METFSIQFESQCEQCGHQRLVDLSGKAGLREPVEHGAGELLNVNMLGTSPGLYVITISHGDRQQRHKLIVE